MREFSPEDVTANIYTMVDVLLHHIHVELKRGHPLQVMHLVGAICQFIYTKFSLTDNIYNKFSLTNNIFKTLKHISLQDLLKKASSNLAFFIWTHELLPLDTLVLALIDRDDDPHALHIAVSFFSHICTPI